MGPIAKARKLIDELNATGASALEGGYYSRSVSYYEHYERQVGEALRGLNAAWANPAFEHEAAVTKGDLLEAWDRFNAR